MHRIAPGLVLLLALSSGPLQAQEWRDFEVDVPQAAANEALARHHAEASAAARRAPEPPPAESLGEAWRRLERALARAGRPRVRFEQDRLVLEATVSISLIIDSTHVDMSFEFEPRVTAPNVVELVAHTGRERWRGRDWKEMVGLGSNLRRLVEEMNAAPGDDVAARHERGRGGAPDRIVIDLAGAGPLEGIEVTGLTARPGVLTLRGRTDRERLTLPLTTADVNDALRKLRNDPANRGLRELLSGGAWLDVGRTNPGRITLDATADLPWLPATKYQAIFRLEVAGPQRLRLVLEDVKIGGDRMDAFLRGRAGAGLKGWLMKKVYDRLDQAALAVAAAYERGETHARISGVPGRPEVRLIDLRPGWAGDVQVRPGFDLEALVVHEGRLEVTTRLAPAAPTAAAPAPTPSRTPGVVGALGGLGD
ncbi:MAG: hypothetical protein M9894_00075 [Planctomycetes bacterium]|nr:hypothetical protein [Planctomycetota bacterium]